VVVVVVATVVVVVTGSMKQEKCQSIAFETSGIFDLFRIADYHLVLAVYGVNRNYPVLFKSAAGTTPNTRQLRSWIC
jgi:hypothetical protein